MMVTTKEYLYPNRMESTPLSSLIAATFDENDTRALVGSVENNCGFVCVWGVCGGGVYDCICV